LSLALGVAAAVCVTAEANNLHFGADGRTVVAAVFCVVGWDAGTGGVTAFLGARHGSPPLPIRLAYYGPDIAEYDAKISGKDRCRPKVQAVILPGRDCGGTWTDAVHYAHSSGNLAQEIR
jgi:hypothetical protein